jgi:lipopolysaccharide assembly outer membrane protein LptD (OstA)
MRRLILAGIVCSTIIAGAIAAAAQSNVSVFAEQSYSEGPVVRFTHFDVILDGHHITADEAIYNPNTGETELRGNVHLALPLHLNNKMAPSTMH